MNEEEDNEGKLIPSVELVPVEIENTALQDFESARKNIHDVIKTAKDAVEECAEIASQAQHPRLFEVLAKLVDSTVAASKSLLEVQEKIRSIKDINSPEQEKTKTINNNLFVGSTAELQKMLKELGKKNDE